MMRAVQLGRVTLESRRVFTGRVELHVISAGPRDGPLVVLLHGFPEFWYGWRHQIPALVERGYRVLAPDQRGYGQSDKPSGIGAYRFGDLAADVVALIEREGRPRAHVVGHDWGAAIAWWVATVHRERVASLVPMNVPHPAVMERFLERDLGQLRRSWYMLFFQLPWLPERAFFGDGGARFSRILAGAARPGAFTPSDLLRYREAWAEPGAVSGMLAWYRAALQRKPARPPDLTVEPPTLVLWGSKDPILGAPMAEASMGLCRDGRLVFLDAGHFVQHDAPDEVNRRLLDFLDEQERRCSTRA